MKPVACLFALILSGAPTARAEVRVYAVHVGVNSPPPDSGLAKLRYSDDDAARFYQFTSSFVCRSVLATVLDPESQRRHPQLAGRCTSPRLDALENALRQMAAEMAADREAGKRVVVYFSYSGHGIREHGETHLALLQGRLTRQWLEAQVMNLPADAIHLFIDACYGQGILKRRGVIARETSARSRDLDRDERTTILRDDLLDHYPQVGALVAATTDREAHEWSRLQSGVFTHELLSALAGAADVNLDGEIAYSEAAAFISSANRSVKDPRAAIRVVSLPPRIDRNAPIIFLAWIPQPSLLEGNPAGLGHFYIETAGGVRALDAHPEPHGYLRLIVPSRQRIWVRSGDIEASFESLPGKTVRFATLRYGQAEELAARGSVDDSLRKGFFASTFGAAYYQGFVDKTGEVGVPFGRIPSIESVEATPSKVPVISCLVGSSLALASTTVFSILAWQAKQDFDATDLQRPAQEAKDRMIRYQALAIGSGLATAGLVLATWLLWPDKPFSLGPGPGGAGSIGLSSCWIF